MALAPRVEREQRLNESYAKAQDRLKPADKEHIAKMLAVVAEMIQCPIPGERVIASYIHYLSEYPADLIDMMGTHIIKTHKYNSYPKVADFVEAVQELFWIRQQALRDIKKSRKDLLGISE